MQQKKDLGLTMTESKETCLLKPVIGQVTIRAYICFDKAGCSMESDFTNRSNRDHIIQVDFAGVEIMSIFLVTNKIM